MEQSKRKKIIIITTNSFPIGLAGTNRIISYCVGFLYHGFRPEVFCIRPTELYKNVINSHYKGEYKGINYLYPGRTTVRVASFLKRRKNDILGILLSLTQLFERFRKNEVLFIIFYGNNIFAELVCNFLCILFRKKIYKEESENPNVYFANRRSFIGKIIKWFFINKLYLIYDGVLVMTEPLKEFFLLRGVPENKIIIIPQTVDLERFEIKEENTNKIENEYIAYAGTLNQEKDGVKTLIESFAMFSDKFPEIHLIIAGDGTSKEKEELLILINQLHLNEKVHFIGRVSSEEIPTFFHEAKVLVSCRPKSIQSDFGFPTKVVEYLASGKPTVTTTTGELAFYLKDRVNAFVANMAEPNVFGSKMLEVLEDYDFAMKVAQNGKELVREKFSPIKQAKMIIDFCIS